MQNSRFANFLIYAFVYSLLYTGVIRKWLLPELSSVLIVVPQIIAVLICFFLQLEARFNLWEKCFIFIGLCVFFTSLIYGHQNTIVALYGCLPYWFGLTTCAILGNIISWEHFVRISRILVYASIFNSILIMLQFSAPVMSFINTANDVVDESMASNEIANLAGGFRPSGIFMHNSQSTLLQAITFPILLYNLLIKRYLSLPLCIIAIILEIVSMPFSISRTNIMYHVGIGVFFLLTCFNRRTHKRVLMTLPVVVIFVLGALSTGTGQQALHTMTQRFENASETLYEGETTSQGTFNDIYDRNIKYNIEAIIDPHTLEGDEVPFWGYGQGMSTQVGGKLLGLTENAGFSLAEWDGLRIMCESGFLFGWIIIIIRLSYAFRFLFHIGEYRRKRNFLAIAILPSFLLSFYLSTTWGNIFQANMAYLIAGLFIAASQSFIHPLREEMMREMMKYQ